jgi:hypothetical protein
LQTAEEVILLHYGHGVDYYYYLFIYFNCELLLVFEKTMDGNHEKMLAKMTSFHENIDARNSELDAHHGKMIASQEWMIAKICLASRNEGRSKRDESQLRSDGDKSREDGGKSR